MPQFICDSVFEIILDSLAFKIKEFYTRGEKQQYPIFIGAGYSGNVLAEKLVGKLMVTSPDTIQFYKFDVENKGKDLKESFGDTDFKGQSILICDSIVNTGRTLSNMQNYFWERGASDVKTLTIFLRNGSSIIPNFWVSTLDKHESILFGIDRYPVKTIKQGSVRKLKKKDCGGKINCGKPFITNTLDDYYYWQSIDPTCCTYIIEDEREFRGILFLKNLGSGTLLVETIAVTKTDQTKGYGSILMKYLKEYCKINKIEEVKLFAHESVTEYYKKFGFVSTGNNSELSSYGKFFEMKINLLE